ncbi:hypothetical protein ACO0RG_001558 [Hanseniaspora osmophila]
MFKRKRLISSYDSDSSSSSDESAESKSKSPVLASDSDTHNESRSADSHNGISPNTALVKSQTNNDSKISGEDSKISGKDSKISGEDSQNYNHIDVIQAPGNAHENGSVLSIDAAKKQYFELFSTMELDPFDPWETQLQVLKEYPEFYLYEDAEKRREWYDEWCSAGNGEGITYSGDDLSLDSEDTSGAESGTDYTPTMYHYLAHVISKSELHTETIYQDIRKKNKQLFKQLLIDENLTRKQQELFTSRLLYYYKHLSLAERENIFLQALKKFRLNDDFTLPENLPTKNWNYILEI